MFRRGSRSLSLRKSSKQTYQVSERNQGGAKAPIQQHPVSARRRSKPHIPVGAFERSRRAIRPAPGRLSSACAWPGTPCLYLLCYSSWLVGWPGRRYAALMEPPMLFLSGSGVLTVRSTRRPAHEERETPAVVRHIHGSPIRRAHPHTPFSL